LATDPGSGVYYPSKFGQTGMTITCCNLYKNFHLGT